MAADATRQQKTPRLSNAVAFSFLHGARREWPRGYGGRAPAGMAAGASARADYAAARAVPPPGDARHFASNSFHFIRTARRLFSLM